MPHRSASRALAGVICLVATPLLRAQDAAPQPQPAPGTPDSSATPPAANSTATPAQEPRHVTFTVSTRGELGFESDLSDGPGKLRVDRGEINIGSGIPVGQYDQLHLGLSGEVDGYSFQDASAVIPGTDDPWDTVLHGGLSAVYFHRQSLQTGWLVGGDVASRGESGAHFSDTLTYDFIAGFRFFASENLTLGLDLDVRTRLEDNVVFIPIPAVDWTINPQWHFEIRSDWNRVEGLLSYSLPETHWTFSVKGGYEARSFRLDRDGPLPGGVVRDTVSEASLVVAYHATRKLDLVGEAGLRFGQSFEVLDDSGDRQRTVDANAAPFIALSARLAF